MQRFLLPFLVLFCPTLALAHSGVEASDGWAPPSLSQSNGVGFVTLSASDDDKLIAASSDCCTAVELHTHIQEGDVVRMRKVDAIPLPDHQSVTLAPGGYHLMLIGLKQPLKEGDEVTVDLSFEKLPPITTTLQVNRGKLLEKLQHSRDGAHAHH